MCSRRVTTELLRCGLWLWFWVRREFEDGRGEGGGEWGAIRSVVHWKSKLDHVVTAYVGETVEVQDLFGKGYSVLRALRDKPREALLSTCVGLVGGGQHKGFNICRTCRVHRS